MRFVHPSEHAFQTDCVRVGASIQHPNADDSPHPAQCLVRNRRNTTCTCHGCRRWRVRLGTAVDYKHHFHDPCSAYRVRSNPRTPLCHHRATIATVPHHSTHDGNTGHHADPRGRLGNACHLLGNFRRRGRGRCWGLGLIRNNTTTTTAANETTARAGTVDGRRERTNRIG